MAHHASASEASVILDVATDQAALTIRDNGQGFDPEEALIREYNREHFGLRGMKERANSLGGTCQLHSKPASGTSVHINIPLDALDRRG